jgi:hypothetical protein
MNRTLTPARGADNGYIPAIPTRSNFGLIDYCPALCHTATMTRTSRKFITVFMLLWLPIFTGNALTAAVSMQMSQGECHVAAMSHGAMDMNMNMDMGEHQMHHGDMPSGVYRVSGGTRSSHEYRANRTSRDHTLFGCISFLHFRSAGSASSRSRLTRDESVCSFQKLIFVPHRSAVVRGCPFELQQQLDAEHETTFIGSNHAMRALAHACQRRRSIRQQPHWIAGLRARTQSRTGRHTL